jgi:hypothetical protein
MSRARLAAFLCVLALASLALAEPLLVTHLRWNGSRVQPVLAGRSGAAEDTVVSLRPATREDPVGYRGRWAYYRLATALGSSAVPPTDLLAMPLREILGLLDADRVARVALPQDLSILNDGTVMTLVTRFPARARPVRLGNAAEADLYYAWAEGRRAVPPAKRGLCASFVEMLILDYLAGNLVRRTFLVDESGPRILLADNDLAFAEIPDSGGLDRTLAVLQRVRAFPRPLVERLRAFDEKAAERVLRPTSEWLVASRPTLQMMDRRKAILSLVDARVAEAGEGADLALP